MSNDKDLASKITEILKENLDDDEYEDMQRPDYYAMLYALRGIKNLLDKGDFAS